MDARRTWLITGASSGFGLAIAQGALERGDSVAATARKVESLEALAEGERIALLPLDVTEADQRTAAVEAVIERFGRIDVLVNNAGRTQVGAVEETTDGELRDLFEPASVPTARPSSPSRASPRPFGRRSRRSGSA